MIDIERIRHILFAPLLKAKSIEGGVRIITESLVMDLCPCEVRLETQGVSGHSLIASIDGTEKVLVEYHSQAAAHRGLQSIYNAKEAVAGGGTFRFLAVVAITGFLTLFIATTARTVSSASATPAAAMQTPTPSPSTLVDPRVRGMTAEQRQELAAQVMANATQSLDAEGVQYTTGYTVPDSARE